MPASPLRRRIFTAVVVAIVLPVGLSGCGVVENLQSAGEDLQRQIGEALGGGESVSDDGDTDIYTFVAGDCIDDRGIDPATETVASVDAADCDTPLESEVIGSVQILGSEYPGNDEVMAQSEELCLAAFEKWTGGTYEEQLDLDFGYFAPTASGWLVGDTTTMCTVLAGGPMTGTAKGAATGRTQLTIGEPTKDPGWIVSDVGNTPIGDLSEGQCIDDAELAEDATIQEVRSVDVVDCASPHASEVLGLASISGEAYWADEGDAFSDAIDAACVPLFESWTGGSYDSLPDLDYSFYLVPTIKASLSTYEGVCTVYSIDGAELTGSTRGAAVVGA